MDVAKMTLRGGLARLACLGLLLGTAAPAAAQPVNSTWPLFHKDQRRTGRTTVEGPALPTNVRIAFHGYSPLRSAPVIGPDGTVYMGSGRTLCAIDPMNNDTVKWCNDTTSSVAHSIPALGVDPDDPMNPAKLRIYIGARDNKLHSVDQDGNTLWKYTVGIDGDVATSAMIADNGDVFFGGSVRFHGIKPDSTLLWVRPLDTAITMASPVLGPGGTLYVGTSGGSLYSITPASGGIKWRLTVARNIRYAAPAVGPDGTIYIGTRDGLVAVTDNGASAVIKWRLDAIGRVSSTPAIAADGTLYVGGSGGTGDAFFSVDPANGMTNWVYQTGDFFRGSPVLDGAGRVYATSGRFILAFDSVTGSLLWSYATGANILSSPALAADGTLWVGSGDRNLYAISD